MSLTELKKAVAELPPEQFSKFTSWFENYIADKVDARIKADAEAGRCEHDIHSATELRFSR